jgi:hypothetical protein
MIPFSAETIGRQRTFMLKIELVPMDLGEDMGMTGEGEEVPASEMDVRLKNQMEINVRSIFTLIFVRGKIIRQPTTTAYLYDFRDRYGNNFQWMTYRAKPSLEEGKTYRIKATVKKHYNRRGIRVTLLTRGKIL